MTDRVAVVVLVDVLDGWQDPYNVAVTLVETALSGDPRGMTKPHRLTERAGTSRTMRGPVPMRADVLAVETIGSALHNNHVVVTPTERHFL